MSEVSAEKIDRRGVGDPTAAARRRTMTIKLKRARQSLTSNSIDFSEQYTSLVRLFANSVMSATPAMALVVIAVGATACLWVPAPKIITWSSLLAAALAVRYGLGVALFDAPDIDKASGSWRRKFVAAETFAGASWALLVVLLLQSPDPNARTFVLVVLLLVSGMTAMVASAIPFAVAGGLSPMAIAIVYVLGPTTREQAFMMSALCVGILVYFVVLANRLHRTSLAGLSFQAEKDALIAELEQAKLNSDEARRRAESANLAKSRFLATMSHELRTPLNAILGFSEVMKAELFGAHSVAAYKDYANDIHSSGQHLLMLINEILDLSRVEAGRYELKEESVSLPGVVEECRHLLAMRAKNRNISITEALDKDLPRIWADERAVRQVTLNLLSNAIKFTPQGGSIAIKVGWTSSGGQYLSIRDTGPGIAEEEIPIVLASFGRGSLAQKNADEGTGLGLPIVKGLVELHGGEFRLQSKLREGTEVTVIFPPERVMNALPQLDPDAPPEETPEQKAGRRARRWGRKAAA
jgi:two-component system cell cycle sensor histidine kinase PleC